MRMKRLVLFTQVLMLNAFLLTSCSKSGGVTPDPPPPPVTPPVVTPPVTEPPGESEYMTIEAVNTGSPIITQYLLYLPEKYTDQQEKWPLVIFLHGAGEIGADIKVLKKLALPKVVKGKPFVMVAPLCREQWWKTDVLESFYKTVTEKYNIDPARIYLTGVSMGGTQTWDWAQAFPAHFAAIVPIAGKGNVAAAASIKTMPVWAFHAADDPQVLVPGSRDIVKALQDMGGNVKYTEYADGGHDSWTRAYATEELYTWLLKQKK